MLTAEVKISLQKWN